MSTRSFPPEDVKTTADEVVDLAEDSTTLDLFFKFTATDPASEDLPDLDSLPFETILPLAEAAEKYQAHILMYICRRRVKTFKLPSYRANSKKYIQAVAYAAQHGYPEIIDELIGDVLRVPLQEFAPYLSGKYLAAWAQYLQNWKDVPVRFADMAKNWSFHAGHRVLMFATVRCVVELNALHSFKDLPTVFNPGHNCKGGSSSCDACTAQFSAWKTYVLDEIDKMPKFSSLAK